MNEVIDMDLQTMGGRSRFITLDQLKTLPAPEPLGPRHKPIHPAEIVETVQDRAKTFGLSVTKQELAINPKKTKVVGTIDFTRPDWVQGGGEELRGGVISFGTSVDQSSSLWMTGGVRIFLCTNLMLSELDVITLRRKHTTGMDIIPQIDTMVEKAGGQVDEAAERIEREDGIAIDERMAFRIVGEMLIRRVLASASATRDGMGLWLDPKTEDVEPRTLWGLHQAYTRQVQKLPPAVVVAASMAVGAYFWQLAQALEAAKESV